MRRLLKRLMLGSTIAASFVIDLDSGAPPGSDLVGKAEAIVGAPMTPVSYAGVARRTTRRVVAVEATEATAAAAAETRPLPPPPQPVVVVAPPPVAAPPPPAAPPASAPAMGTIVANLPPGCTPMAVRGVEYYYCEGVFYRAAFQSNNLVYVVSQP